MQKVNGSPAILVVPALSLNTLFRLQRNLQTTSGRVQVQAWRLCQTENSATSRAPSSVSMAPTMYAADKPMYFVSVRK
jgi:hypothetical protein